MENKNKSNKNNTTNTQTSSTTVNKGKITNFEKKQLSEKLGEKYLISENIKPILKHQKNIPTESTTSKQPRKYKTNTTLESPTPLKKLKTTNNIKNELKINGNENKNETLLQGPKKQAMLLLLNKDNNNKNNNNNNNNNKNKKTITTTKNIINEEEEDDDLDLDELFDKRKQIKKDNKIEKEKQKIQEDNKNKLKKTKKEILEEDDFFDSRGLNIKERKYTDGFPVFTEEELNLDIDGGETDLCPFDCNCCH